MTALVDTAVIASQFSRAAQTYDAWAEPQTISAKRLCSFLPKKAERIADLGCGTGIMTRLLRQTYPTAYITGVDPAVGMIEQCQKLFADDEKTTWLAAPAEAFNAPANLDLVVSTNSFHWFRDKRKALDNIYGSLKPSGRFVIAASLSHTLQELYKSYFAATGTEIHYADLSTEEDLSTLFMQSGFTIKEFVIDEFQMCLPTPMHLIHFLQAIGGAPPGICRDTLLPEEQLHKLVSYYADHFALDGGVAATYQYLYGVVEK